LVHGVSFVVRFFAAVMYCFYCAAR